MSIDYNRNSGMIELPLLDQQALALAPNDDLTAAGAVHCVRLDQVRLWAGNPRSLEPFDQVRDRELVTSLRDHGQKIPCVGRYKSGGTVELIVGCRRFGALSHLAEGQPDFKLLIEVRELSDQEAFVLVDAENAARKNVSAYERATYHQWALKELFGERQSELAAKLKISPTTLSRSLDLIRLPEEVYAIINDRHGLTPNLVATLAPRCDDPEVRQQVIAAALAISAEGETLPAKTAIARIVAQLNGLVITETMLVKHQGTGQHASIRLGSKNSIVVTIPTAGLKPRERARYVKQVLGEVAGYADRAIPTDV